MNNKANANLAWVALYMIHGLGHTIFKKLLDQFGKPETVFKAQQNDIAIVAGKEVARRIVKRQFTSDPEKELLKIEKAGVNIINFYDHAYPALLKEIHRPPMLLFAKGLPIPLQQIMISVVGTRNPTHYGIKTAEMIGLELAKKRVGVVSGMAYGIDTAAHRGCLKGKGYTIAVLGCGVDVIYPASNKKLVEQLMEHGTIISEFPLGTPPEARNFPIRNRIISGLTDGVVVVEAAKKSGSLITASLALDQGREVFAVPGSIDSFKSRGTHHLIRQGAKLIENVDDILDEFEFQRFPEGGEVFNKTRPHVSLSLNDEERKIYNTLGQYPLHIDEIVRMSGLDPGRISSILMEMELKEIVKQLTGKRFIVT